MENSANEANYEELGNHIKLLAGRGKAGTLTPAQAEDLEDYYERLLQLRVTQNNTLIETLKEEREKSEQQKVVIEQVWTRLYALTILICVTLIYASILRWPRTIVPIFTYLIQVCVYPPVLVFLTFVIAKKIL